MPTFERILVMGITGSGKSYQWLKLAEALLPTGVVFRCVDTDNAITYMLETQFPHLKPENKGNVYVQNVFEWPDYKSAIKWLQRKPMTPEQLSLLTPNALKDYNTSTISPNDWSVVDMADIPWRMVQSYFVHETFGEDPGDYFLRIRKEMQAGLRKTAKGGMPASTITEALDGWRDWGVINKLYDDWILPLIYRIPTHVYATTKVEPIARDEKDPEILTLFGDLGVKPAGQKALGHQMHAIFLFIPGRDKWFLTTAKDRAGRSYFNKAPLKSLHLQYLCVKAGWPMT